MIQNWTPHTVRLVREDLEDVEFPSVGQCRARVSPQEMRTTDTPHGPIGIVPPPSYSAIEWKHPDEATPGMHRPEPRAEDNRPGTVIVSFIVAPLVAKESPEFRVWVPDTGPGSVIRDDAGQIVGVRRMVEFSPGIRGTMRDNYVPDPSKKRIA